MLVYWDINYGGWVEYNIHPDQEAFKDSEFDGWIPLPHYKP